MNQLYLRVTRKVIPFFFALTSFLPVGAQTTPLSGITAFNGISTWDYIEYAYTMNATFGFQATNVHGSGWDIRGFSSGPGDCILAGENWAGGSDGGFVYLASVMGESSIVSMRFKANDGKLFNLNGIDLGYDAIGGNIGFTITGFRNNVMVTGASYLVTSFSSFGNGGGWRRAIDISSNSNFKGIDEFRITPNSANVLMALDVDNINAVNFRSADFAQIIPGDIPAGNEGSFSKSIGGQNFLFTPAADNWVAYNNDIGSQGFGGLYAYDYTTMDGTEETLTPPAGYSFDLSGFQYVSDRGTVNLAVMLTFTDNSTDTKNYILTGNSAVQNFTGFITAANDVKKIRLVSDALVYYNNFEISDIKTYTILPLKWLRFTAAKQNDAVVLNWTTSNEVAAKDFLVEHSINGREWKPIGTVAAAATNGADQSYSFVHETPANGLNLYRLLQRDHDGRGSYSSIVSVSYYNESQAQVFPNPVTNGSLQVKLITPGLVRLYNSAGMSVMERQLPAGTSTLDVHHLAKGMYTIMVNDLSTIVMVQ